MEDNMQINDYVNLLRESQLRAESEKIKNVQQEVMLQQQDASIIREQLDLGEELVRIDYLLRGYSYERDEETGEDKWVPPKDNDMIILSDYGIHLIRNTIAWYLNKNTLLSNYDEDTILHKMEDFASDLNDTIFMEYERVFLYPTFEDCKRVLNERIEHKKDVRVYALEILGIQISHNEREKIRKDILKELEPTLEKELEKIKAQLMKNKLKRYLMIIRKVQDAVHSTYNRAFGGQERKTLREHIHISETKGMPSMPQQSRGGLFGFFSRKK